MPTHKKDLLRIVGVAVAVVLAILAATTASGAERFPLPQGAVNDFASVIPGEERIMMTNLAGEVLEKTGTSLVVVTMGTIGDNDPDDYANRLYQAWGIGKKGEDKGVLIFLAVRERKIRIETGYGLEGILPDGLVGEILDRDVIPFLKGNDYGRGLANGMLSVASIVAKNAGVTLNGRYAGQTQAPAQRKARSKGNLFPLLVLLFVLLPLLATRQGRAMLPFILLMMVGGGGRGGGGFGGFGGGGFGGFGGGGSGGGGAGRGF